MDGLILCILVLKACVIYFQIVARAFCSKTTNCLRTGTERVREKRKCAMWATVQVENVSTCVAREADINDLGVVLLSERHRKELSIIFSVQPCPLYVQGAASLRFLFFYCVDQVLFPLDSSHSTKHWPKNKWLPLVSFERDQ